MISPEQLRRLPLFGMVSEEHLRRIAMVTDEMKADQGEVLFDAGQKAEGLYILLRGSVDLLYTVSDSLHPEIRREFLVGEVNPGEVFGISALIEPYVYTSAARTADPVELLKISSDKLCSLCDLEPALGYLFMKRMAQAALERLEGTRIQLAACWNK